MKVTLVVQARTGSSRLPARCYCRSRASLLLRQLERLSAVQTPHELCVATTTHESDEPIRQLSTRGIRCVNGSEHDLLDRHYPRGTFDVGGRGGQGALGLPADRSFGRRPRHSGLSEPSDELRLRHATCIRPPTRTGTTSR